jgi:hypothetical protein
LHAAGKFGQNQFDLSAAVDTIIAEDQVNPLGTESSSLSLRRAANALRGGPARVE